MSHISIGKDFALSTTNMKTSTLKLSVILNKRESCHSYPASEVFFPSSLID